MNSPGATITSVLGKCKPNIDVDEGARDRHWSRLGLSLLERVATQVEKKISSSSGRPEVYTGHGGIAYTLFHVSTLVSDKDATTMLQRAADILDGSLPHAAKHTPRPSLFTGPLGLLALRAVIANRLGESKIW